VTTSDHGSSELHLHLCPKYAEADKAYEAKRAEYEAAVAQSATKDAERDAAQTRAADPAKAAEAGLQGSAALDQARDAENAAYAAAVKVNSLRTELAAAGAERRKCAERAGEIVGTKAKAQLDAIHARHAAAKAELERCIAEEAALIQATNDAIRPAFSNERTAGYYGVALRPAVG
jgi:hypothetical protein